MKKRRLVKIHFLKFLSNKRFNFCISAYLFSCQCLLFNIRLMSVHVDLELWPYSMF